MRSIYRYRYAYLFISPFYFIFLAFLVFPIGFSFALSFVRWNGISAWQFVGLRNYVALLTDAGFHLALLNTGLFTVMTVALGAGLGLGLAIFLNSVRFLKRFYRGVFFIPSVVSLVVVSLVWKLILNSEYGLANGLILATHDRLTELSGWAPAWMAERVRFLDSSVPLVPLLTITLVNVWGVVGFNTVIYLAGLQGIPTHLYDVSRIDGATAWQNFRFITLPLLRPTTFFVVLISTIDALQVFVLPAIMNRDSDSTMTVVYYLYRNAFEFYRMGYASAVAYILFGLTVLLGVGIRMTVGRDARLAFGD